MLVELGVVRPEAEPSGPELLMAAEEWLESRKSEPVEQSDSLAEEDSRFPPGSAENGLICSICKHPQWDTPHGTLCENGHGGVEGLSSTTIGKDFGRPREDEDEGEEDLPF
jgi:hypothetical protein